MLMNKRRFLVSAGGAAALPWLLVSPSSAALALPAGRLPALGDSAGLRHWQAYLHQRFDLEDSAGRTCELTLSALRNLASSGPVSEQFALSFTGEGSQPLSAGLYSLRHANGQVATLYLSEADDAGRPALRAEFNLLRQRAWA